MTNCPVCKHEDNLKITNAILRGTKTVSDGLKYFSVDRKVMENHLKAHIRVLSQGDNVVAVENKELDGIGMLTDLAPRLNELLEELLSKAENDIEMANIRGIKGLVDSIRGCIKDVAELRGDLVTHYKVELQLQKNEIDGIYALMTQDLCDDCKKKVLSDM